MVWTQIVRLQRNFLRGGWTGASKIAWVNWEDVFKYKRVRGLGVRDLRLVNLAMLGKWRWRLLSEGAGLWKDILVTKYRVVRTGSHHGGHEDEFRVASSWWKNILLLWAPFDSTSDWFSESVIKVIGNGLTTSFWNDSWIGDDPLKVCFPRHYQVSVQRVVMVRNLFSWVGEVWVWDLRWIRLLFV
ncbi:ribonuclease H protein [Trifolium medium]|uniref:Ribonuclease H protein n=1 Tax=Trifolium medium TaxID=97028 RepID=A0A392MHV6_9FABA|nr:ribonuclease H protein [Trifolium medium]